MERKVVKTSIHSTSTASRAIKASVPGKPQTGKGRGGWRPGAGRKRGRSAAQTAFEKLMRDNAESLEKSLGRKPTALECYQSVYQDFKVPYAVREQAKRMALPFESSRLSPTVIVGAGSGTVTNEQRINDARASLKRKLAKTTVAVHSGAVAGQANS